MINPPLVSISIPAYNHEKYVQECIQSIIDQDWPRIELIVIDDGSTDSTWARIQEMRRECERRFERVVLETRPNKGCAATVRDLAALKHGEIRGGIASDDRYLPGAIANMAKVLVENDDVGLCVGTNILIDSEGRRCYWDERRNNVYDEALAAYKTLDEFTSKYSGIDFNSAEFGKYATFRHCNYIPNGSLCKAHFLNHEIPYNPRALLEDLWFHLQLSKHAKYRHIEEPTFCYRWHGANTAANRKRILEMEYATKLCERELLMSTGDTEHMSIFGADFAYERTVWEKQVGNFRFSIRDRRDFATRRWQFLAFGHAIPLTPAFKY
ncbi:MAG: glycosyltransferase family 2 protein [Kiritimatiellae bacterium]|nr:glycosyltransferase family 2 protein [Kiritimatiellia bacterium]